MSVLLRIAICTASVLLIAMVVRSLVNREMTEKQSIFWFFCGIVVFVFGLFPSISGFIATIFGVEYIPSIIFTIAIVMAMYGIFNCFQSIAGLHKRVQELAMHVSLLNQENSILLDTVKKLNRTDSADQLLSSDEECTTK